MSSTLRHNASVACGSALVAAVAIGTVETLAGRAASLPIWNTASVPLTLLWAIGVWSLVGAVVGTIGFVVTTLFRLDARSTAQRLLHLSMGKGESSIAVVPVALLAFGLPPLLEGSIGTLTDGLQLPGMAGAIVTWAVVLVGVFVVHRGVAWWRPAYAAGPRAVVIVFCIHLYAQLGNVSVLAPYKVWPFIWVLLPAIALTVGSIDDVRARRPIMGLAALGAICGVVTLFSYDTRTSEHAAGVQGTRLFESAIRTVWLSTDFDADRTGWLLDHGDCAPFDGDRVCREVAAREPARPADGKREASAAQNVILITVDSLRADHVGLEVDGRPLTPNIDSFFADSHHFSRAYSPSTHTKEAIPALMLGAQPRHALASDKTLAEHLRGDWNRAAVTAIPGPPPVLARGFGKHFDNSIGTRPAVWSQVTAYEAVLRSVGALKAARQATKPLFLWLHVLDPHAYYVSESKFADWLGNDSLKAHYRHEVHRTDDALGQLFLALKDLGYLADSLIVLTSDHGEAFGEHGTFTHVWEGYDSVTRVPLMIRVPDMAGGRHDEVVSLVDVKPTLLELLGRPATQNPYGRSLAPAMRGEEIEKRPAYFHAHYQGRDVLFGAVFDETKVIYNAPASAWEMYDLETDPGETQNLVSPELVQPFERRIWGWWYSDRAPK